MKAVLLNDFKTKCSNCNKRLIVQEADKTIVKTKVLVISSKGEMAEIKCSNCGHIEIVVFSS